ncbi:conserved hypothetical protein [Tenacibaculum sp. 190130A14a]|uniref:Outer membrane lipoprotein-sorting protein n=2 Tax=Tenacibaculum polynesiense TaxID=3137857 RepID=A0ABM9P7G5_9FLAO
MYNQLDLIRMKYLFILIFFSLVSCSSTKKLTENSTKPTKFVFKESMVSIQTGISDLETKTKGKDSLLNKKLNGIKMSQLLLKKPNTEIYVEIENDTVWRYTKQEGIMIGDYFMIQKNTGVLHYYDKSKSINYKKYDLFAKNHEYEIIENREDVKEIKGFKCYKLTLIKKERESDLGYTKYEMYVSDQIELPIHSVINLTKFMPNTFPMEIRISNGDFSGVTQLYELIKID